MPTSYLSELFSSHEERLLIQWQQSMTALIANANLMRPEGLKSECTELLSLLRQALENAHSVELTGEGWSRVRNFLTQISCSRAIQGFTPSATARFVLSLKEPIFQIMRVDLTLKPTILADEIWKASVIIDDLALHTADAFIQAKEVVILRQQAEMLEFKLTEERSVVQARIKELARDQAVSTAETANKAKSVFLANMSHELRTPLNAIIGFSQMLDARMSGELNPKQARQVGHIVQGGHYLLKLINEILDLSAIEAGKLDMEIGPVDLQEIAAQVYNTTHALANDKHLQLTFSVPAMQITGDGGRIAQILLNLVANAIKFTPDGGKVDVQARHLEDDRGRWIRMTIIDTGIGIKPDDLTRLFVEFGRIDDSYVQATVGTGLGLALTRRLVELHGGHISVASPGLGKGSTFTVDLPAVTLPSIQPMGGIMQDTDRVTLPQPVRSSRGLILVVDDDRESQNILADVLTLGRYEVLKTVTVDQALEQLKQRLPLAVILDTTVQGARSGWEVLDFMQASPQLRSVPVIALSLTDEGTLARSRGAAASLLKPADSAQVLSMVNQACRRKRDNRTILMVTQDTSFSASLSSSLRERNWNVLIATSGAEAVSVASRRIPVVAIIDQTLPDLSGIALMEWLDRIPALAQLPVLLITDQALDTADIARFDHDRHGVALKRQTVVLMTEIERLSDRLPPLETVEAMKDAP